MVSVEVSRDRDCGMIGDLMTTRNSDRIIQGASPAHLKGSVRVFAFIALIPAVFAITAHSILYSGTISLLCIAILGFMSLTWGLVRFAGRLPGIPPKAINAAVDTMIAGLWGASFFVTFSYFGAMFDSGAMIILFVSIAAALVIRFLLMIGESKDKNFGLFFGSVSLAMLFILTWKSSYAWIYRHNPDSLRALNQRDLNALAIEDRTKWLGKFSAKSLPRANPGQSDLAKSSWSYDGANGPSSWGQLSQEFVKCSSGKFQSPIDIPRRASVTNEQIRLKWQAEDAFIDGKGPLTELKFQGLSKVSLRGESFILKKAQFHSPSEHQISGLSFPMEVQFYLEGPTGKSAMFAVFIEVGAKHLEIEKMISKLKSLDSLDSSPVNFSPRSFLPSHFNHYRYEGSLTFPPCSEGVSWYVFGDPIEMSSEQIAALRSIIGHNARPVQSLGSRSFDVDPKHFSH